ncbi:MAG: 8-amino-7-oxononanoate synthase [Deltaproteobacteria bacterium]|nr:8-amino-7-oxononanoate synthase [Deltaproteobacteria bacterium]
MFTKLIAAELQEIKRQGLYRQLRHVEGEQGPTISLDGQEVLNLSSNNYLGLANHPAMRAAAKEAIDRYACGSGASRLISGNMTLHLELEESIAKLKGAEAALVFNSGFQANVGLLSTLVGEGDVIFSDALNHASIIDGCRLSRAEALIYPHCDLDRLESDLRKTQKNSKKLIVTETVFSMDGDIAPVREIADLAARHGAVVMVDEAHATGVFGPNGGGIVEEMGLVGQVLIQMGTLGKALGGFGAYVAGSRNLRDLLINRCRSFIFTTSLPPVVIAMAIAAIDIIKKEPQRRRALRDNSKTLREGLERMGFSLGRSGSQILPLMVGDSAKCMILAERLLQNGVFAQGIRPPSVPPGTSRLRIVPMATHTREQMEQALRAFKDAKEDHGLGL